MSSSEDTTRQAEETMCALLRQIDEEMDALKQEMDMLKHKRSTIQAALDALTDGAAWPKANAPRRTRPSTRARACRLVHEPTNLTIDFETLSRCETFCGLSPHSLSARLRSTKDGILKIADDATITTIDKVYDANRVESRFAEFSYTNDVTGITYSDIGIAAAELGITPLALCQKMVKKREMTT